MKQKTNKGMALQIKMGETCSVIEMGPEFTKLYLTIIGLKTFLTF